MAGAEIAEADMLSNALDETAEAGYCESFAITSSDRLLSRQPAMPLNSFALSRLLIAERPSLLRRLVSIVGNEAAAEDVAQTLWLRIQKVEDEPPIVNKRSFLFRLASNLAIDHLRAERRKGAVFVGDEAAATVAAPEPDAETRLLDMEKLRLLDAVIATLPLRCRQVFILTRIDELSIPETARQLGISEDMVRKHIRHALSLCHAAIYGAPDR